MDSLYLSCLICKVKVIIPVLNAGLLGELKEVKEGKASQEGPS